MWARYEAFGLMQECCENEMPRFLIVNVARGFKD